MAIENFIYFNGDCRQTIEETHEIFDRLKDGGKVKIDLQEVFFTKCLGSLTDKFGVNWFVVFYPESE